MKIKLNDKYQVTGVPMNFILEEKKIHSEGKVFNNTLSDTLKPSWTYTRFAEELSFKR